MCHYSSVEQIYTAFPNTLFTTFYKIMGLKMYLLQI